MRRHRFLLLSTLLCMAAPAAPAQQVHRCVTPEGQPLYSDRPCEDQGAIDRLPPLTSAPFGSRNGATEALQRGGCPRTVGALVREVGSAVRSGDVNRLAGLYDWRGGASGAAASRIMDRLERVAERPLVDIAPIYPPEFGSAVVDDALGFAAGATANTAAQEAAGGSDAIDATDTEPPQVSTPGSAPPAGAQARLLPSWYAGAALRDTAPQPVPETPAEPPPTVSEPPRQRPVGLRLEQTLPGSATPARAEFSLRRGFGCFWIAF